MKLRLVDPPAGISLGMHSGRWFQATVNGAEAFLFTREAGQLLLHWIESSKPGAGSRLLAELCEYADEHHIDMVCLADPNLSGWYERHGWRVVKPGVSGVEFARQHKCTNQGGGL